MSTEFRKQYQNESMEFYLWSHDKIAEFWWKMALEWVKEKLNCEIMPGDIEYFIDKELKEYYNV